MLGDLLQVVVGQKFQQVIHRRVSAPPVPERHQLVVEITRRLSRQPRKIDIAGALALRTVARRAGENARGHGIRRALLRPRRGGKKWQRKDNEKRWDWTQMTGHRCGPNSTPR